MKKIFLFTLLYIINVSFISAQQQNYPLNFLPQKFSVSFSGGASILVSGNYNSSIKMNDLLKTGASFNAAVSYSLSSFFSVRTSFDFSYNYFNTQYSHMDMKHIFVAPSLNADAIVKFGSLFNGTKLINPYLFGGIDLYCWKFSQNEVDGDPILSVKGKEWKDDNIGLHAGAGFELILMNYLSLFAEGQFRYIFSSNTANFGSDFQNIGLIKISAGITYYF